MKGQFVAMLACSLVLVCGGNDPTTSYGQEVEVGAETTSKASREDEWRAEFLARVANEDKISHQLQGQIRL